MYMYPIQSTHMHPSELDQQEYTLVIHDHPIASFNSNICKPLIIANKSPQLEYNTCML